MTGAASNLRANRFRWQISQPGSCGRNICDAASDLTSEILQATRAGLSPALATNAKSRQIREHPDPRVSYLPALRVRRAGQGRRVATESVSNLCSICGSLWQVARQHP